MLYNSSIVDMMSGENPESISINKFYVIDNIIAPKTKNMTR